MKRLRLGSLPSNSLFARCRKMSPLETRDVDRTREVVAADVDPLEARERRHARRQSASEITMRRDLDLPHHPVAAVSEASTIRVVGGDTPDATD
jgi:hypothetical protein